jgi:hypothetical protein
MPTSFRSYAVDGGADGHRDLWGDWSDVFASVGNYLKLHGWRPGEPVMVAADVSAAKLDGVEVSKLDLSESVGSLRERGVRFDTSLPGEARAVLIELTGAAGPEYRVGFANFNAITRYNRSALYASAVNDLAEELQAAPGAAPEVEPEATPETLPVTPPEPAVPETVPVTPAPVMPPPAEPPATDEAPPPEAAPAAAPTVTATGSAPP